MRSPLTLVAAALATLVTLTPATASAETHEPVGGPRMAERGLVVSPGAPRLPRISAAGWIIADMATGQVLAAKDPHGRYAPASTMKVLTAHTVMKNLAPTTMVLPTFEDVNVEGSKVGIVNRMRYSVKDLLTGMMVVSGNDAANALATANGGRAATLAQMNAEAARLQAFDTRAMNPSGLDHPKQLSSPYDLALIGREAMTSDDFRRYVATKRYYMPAPGGKKFYIATHNRLVWNYDGAIGIKNGYTVRARATFVGAATRNGRTLIIAMMKTIPRYWPEAAALLDWGFKAADRGVTPVGELVDPVEEEQPEPQAAEVAAPPVAARTAEPGSDVPVLPTLLVGAGVAVLGAGVVRTRRQRRRRPRSRLRLDLPL